MDQRLEMTCGIGELKRLLRTKYDFVCSIGPDCGCAAHLVRCRLRRASYPLDWIGTWTLGVVTLAKLVANDFAGFLRQENLRRCEKQTDGPLDDSRHDWYSDDVMHIDHLHDFPAGRPLEESYPEVRRKFDRRIKRFYDTVRASKRTLFVYWTWRNHPEEAELLRMAEVFRGKFPGVRIDLLVMRHADHGGIKARAIGDGVVLVDAPIHPAGGHPAFGDTALNRKLFGTIRLRGNWRTVLRARLAHLATRARAVFIFNAEKRRAYRRSLRKTKIT